jgi:translation elongation factor P/translation initiation factor 5A
MASTSDIRNGLCIKFNHDIYKIIEFLHVKPGKGPAFVRTKLRSLTNGKVLDNTFSAGHKIEEVRVETQNFQYLYAEGDQFHFMNTESYEQITLEKKRFKNLTRTIFENRQGSIYQLYQVKYGQSVARTRERLRAGLAGKQFAGWLELKPQSPVITIRRVAFNLQDEPIEWRISTLNTTQHEYFNELVV